MEVVRQSTKEEALQEVARHLNEVFHVHANVPILFLSSGGSALELLEGVHLAENVTVSVLDERYSKNPTVNNFAQLFGNIHPTTFIDTRVKDNETLRQLAERFEKELRLWKEKNPSGKVIITQGVGSDGHTAGIMPYPENPELFRQLFDAPDHWVVGYDATKGKNEYPLRVTVTMPFLREVVDHSLVYVTGESKKEALARILSSQGNLWETPGRIIREMKNVKIFTDIVY